MSPGAAAPVDDGDGVAIGVTPGDIPASGGAAVVAIELGTDAGVSIGVEGGDEAVSGDG
jgi:hypothetical protein